MRVTLCAVTDKVNIEFICGELSLGNCGMSGIYEAKTMYTSPDGSQYQGYIQQTHDVWPSFGGSKAKLYEALCAHIAKISEKYAGKGMVFLSDRVVWKQESSFAEKNTEPNAIDTLWLMRAIRDTKHGTLVTSPIVENPNHPDQSAIMAAFWIPPGSSDRILHDKIGVLRPDSMPKSRVCQRQHDAAKQFAKEFYGSEDPLKYVRSS